MFYKLQNGTQRCTAACSPIITDIFTHVILHLNRKAHAVYINTKFINPAHLQMCIILIFPPHIKKFQPFKSCKATSVIYSSHQDPVLSSLITVSYGFNTSRHAGCSDLKHMIASLSLSLRLWNFYIYRLLRSLIKRN